MTTKKTTTDTNLLFEMAKAGRPWDGEVHDFTSIENPSIKTDFIRVLTPNKEVLIVEYTTDTSSEDGKVCTMIYSVVLDDAKTIIG